MDRLDLVIGVALVIGGCVCCIGLAALWVAPQWDRGPHLQDGGDKDR